ncbi:50S ribosomal protein L32 [Rickettsiales bacterium]|nr:50S ribosomal protein L32 [Rickettsiales bacterium]
MAVPKKKKSKSRCGHNNSHNALDVQALSFDERGDIHQQHIATKLPDGSVRYKNRVIVKAKEKKIEKNS